VRKEVLIVEPTSSGANVFSFFNYLPLLGPLYLGTILRKNGFKVRVLNENILKRKISPDELDADFLLLSCLTTTVSRGYALARQYKRMRPGGKVIIGGPHVTFMKEEAIEYVDHVVLGEGENVIVDLLKYGSDEKFVQGTKVEDMDSLPLIDWSILRGNEKGGVMPIMTSRGCPFACNFCSVAEMFGRKFRAMSAERVIEEVKLSTKKDIFFYDDNLTADINRAHRIMDGLISLKRGHKTWSAQVRSDVVRDEELVEKMARSGCGRVYIGFESINPSTLRSLKKAQTPADISRAVSVLHKFGISVHGMFMFGSDSDDSSVIGETEAFVKKSRIDSVQYMILTPLPGTELFRQMESSGRLIHRNWDHYDAQHVVFWPERFSPFDLQQFMVDSFKDFYSFTNAANEIINMLVDRTANDVRGIFSSGVFNKSSIRNVLLKAGGKFIVNKWQRINRSYLDYLQHLT